MSFTKKHDTFIDHVIIYGAGTILLHAGTFLLVPLYTYHLTKEDFGILDIISQLGQALNICLMVQGIRLATTNFYRTAKNVDEKKRVVATLISMIFPLLLLGNFIVYLLSDDILKFLSIPSKNILILGIAAVSFEAVLTLPLTILQARLESVLFVKISCLIFLCRTLLIIINVVVFKLGILGVLVGDFIVLSSFGIILISRELLIGSYKPDIIRYIDILKFTLPFVPAAALGFFIYSADRFFLVKYVGIAEVGLFALAMKLISGVSTLVVSPIMRVWQTKLYDVFSTANAQNEVGIWYLRIFMTYLFAIAMSVIFRDEIFYIIAPESYRAATIYVLPLSVAAFSMSMANLLESSFYYHQKTYYKIPVNLITAFTIGVLLYIITPKYGAMGTAICLVTAYALHLLLTFVVTQRILRVHLPINKALLFIISIFVLGVLCELFPITIFGFIFKIIIVVIFLYFILIHSNLLHEDDRKYIFDYMTRTFKSKSRVILH